MWDFEEFIDRMTQHSQYRPDSLENYKTFKRYNTFSEVNDCFLYYIKEQYNLTFKSKEEFKEYILSNKEQIYFDLYHMFSFQIPPKQLEIHFPK